MIVRLILFILFILLATLANFYVALWRVRRQLRPAALLLDEGLQTLQGGLFKTAMANGHFHGRSVRLLILLGRWTRTLRVRMACDSPLDFTIWTPGEKGAPKALPVDGYLVLADAQFDRELESVSCNPSRFAVWAQQRLTKDRLDVLTNAKDNWCLELRSGTIEWTDFAYRKGEFTSPEFPKRLEALAHLASSLEAAAGDAGGPETTGHASET